jgi:beta-1,4-mannosyltransferase
MTSLPTDRANPYITQLCTELERLGVVLTPFSLAAAKRADVLHFHWPDHFVNREGRWLAVRGVVKVLLACALTRRRHRAVVWTVHNLRAHDGRHPWLEWAFWPAFTSLLSGYICLTHAGRELAAERFRRLRHKPAAVIAHGSYDGVYPDYTGSAASARTALNLPAEVAPLLFFGNIRRYKNVPRLIEAFAGTTDDRLRLIVAGFAPDAADLDALRVQAAGDSRVLLGGGYVADDEVAVLFKAAVGVVLPYVDVLNSGALYLALSMSRPVLLPRTPVFEEVRTAVGAGWISFYEGRLEPADLEAFARHAEQLDAEPGAPDLSASAWPALAERLLDFYRSLLGFDISASSAISPSGPTSDVPDAIPPRT